MICGAGEAGAGAACTSRRRVAGVVGQPQAGREPGAGLPAQGEAVGEQALREPQGPARPGRHHRGQAFRKNAARTRGRVAKQLAHLELEAHRVGAPGDIGEGAVIPTVDAGGRGLAERAGRLDRGGRHLEREGRRQIIKVPGLQGQGRGIGQKMGKQGEQGCGNESGVSSCQGIQRADRDGPWQAGVVRRDTRNGHCKSENRGVASDISPVTRLHDLQTPLQPRLHQKCGRAWRDYTPELARAQPSIRSSSLD